METAQRKPLDRKIELEPLVRAEGYTRCFLCWMPVSAFPIRAAEREWQLLFFDRLSELLTKKFGLRAETFIESKAIEPHLMNRFLNTAEDFVPIIGMSRSPGEMPPPIPSAEAIEDLQQGRRKFSFGDYAASYCYWFLDKQPAAQRKEFLGYGGLTTLFLKPDPQTQPMKISYPKKFMAHPLFANFKFDPDRMRQRTCSLLDKFLAASKAAFGAGLESDPQYRGLLFIVPVLQTKHFFERSEAEVAKWFEVFDVYIAESAPDQGLVIASKTDIEDDLVELLNQMREEGARYNAAR